MINTRPYTTDFVTSKDGSVIGYRQLGQGPGLILVHGGMQASQSFMSLAAALHLPAIQKLAVYEPPLSINHSAPTAWLRRCDDEIAGGRLAAALVTALKGTQNSPLFTLLPRFVLLPLVRMASAHEKVEAGDIPVRALIPTMHFDVQLVIEMEGTLGKFKELSAEVLLLGGNKSPAFLHVALDALSTVLPHRRRAMLNSLDHQGPDNSGNPKRVALELRRFFTE